ncbi:hypothetical protein A6R68_24024 [Neotoma lepida]|uniref:Uncharacterized protein n=1 Tax=Neotoma lepida TaxID=56216 RepID=A0A1A6HW80_NEOLE|nr:hypothetical protein A6R68_24024 [Neotoma lepida]
MTDKTTNAPQSACMKVSHQCHPQIHPGHLHWVSQGQDSGLLDAVGHYGPAVYSVLILPFTHFIPSS